MPEGENTKKPDASESPPVRPKRFRLYLMSKIALFIWIGALLYLAISSGAVLDSGRLSSILMGFAKSSLILAGVTAVAYWVVLRSSLAANLAFCATLVVFGLLLGLSLSNARFLKTQQGVHNSQTWDNIEQAMEEYNQAQVAMLQLQPLDLQNRAVKSTIEYQLQVFERLRAVSERLQALTDPSRVRARLIDEGFAQEAVATYLDGRRNQRLTLQTELMELNCEALIETRDRLTILLDYFDQWTYAPETQQIHFDDSVPLSVSDRFNETIIRGQEIVQRQSDIESQLARLEGQESPTEQ